MSDVGDIVLYKLPNGPHAGETRPAIVIGKGYEEDKSLPDGGRLATMHIRVFTLGSGDDRQPYELITHVVEGPHHGQFAVRDKDKKEQPKQQEPEPPKPEGSPLPPAYTPGQFTYDPTKQS